MKSSFRSRNFYFILFMDGVLVVACFYLAYLFRFEFSIPEREFTTFIRTCPYILVVKLCTFAFFRIYKGMWRYTSLVDLVNVVKAVLTSSALIILGVLMIHRFEGYPRSVFIIDGCLTLLAIGGIRAAIRVYFARRSGMDIFPSLHNNRSKEKRLLILGAGDAGEKILREIQDNPRLKFDPVGFLDDDPGKQRKTIHGVPVLGTINDIESHAASFDEILISIPSCKGDEMRRIVDLCERTGKRYRTMPSIGELIDGRVSVKAIRDVRLEDLLGREEVQLDYDEIKQYLHQKRILVTGAGGSIGRELVRQISRFHPQALALMDVSEFNLFMVEAECQQRFGYVNTLSFLADIRERKVVSHVFKEFSPQVVFHAAAYKHVPVQELNPWEAVSNNVSGSRNILEASHDAGVERFVLVSTDKAVRPTNVMGATKRIGEMIMECMNGNSSTLFMAVRFGNVIGSSGSAIPLFQEQIARGGPVTVTHPEVTRYFMSIPEAAQLILQAGAMGEGGEIFILDMGNPIRILDVARDLIRLHGFEPDRDIPIQFIGLRPGEKLYEELIPEGEGIVTTKHDKILVLRGNSCDSKVLNARVDELLAIAGTYDAVTIKKKLQEIVPEYSPQL